MRSEILCKKDTENICDEIERKIISPGYPIDDILWCLDKIKEYCEIRYEEMENE